MFSYLNTNLREEYHVMLHFVGCLILCKNKVNLLLLFPCSTTALCLTAKTKNLKSCL